MLVGSSLTTAEVDSVQLEASRRLAAVYARVATTRPVLERVIDRAGLNITTEDLGERLTVTTLQEPSIITLTAAMSDPDTAAVVVNSIVDELLSLTPDSTDQTTQDFIVRQLTVIEGEIESLIGELETLSGLPTLTAAQLQRRADLQLRLTELQSAYALLTNQSRPAGNTLTILEEGVADPIPTAPRPQQNGLIAAFLGLVMALIAAVLRDHGNDAEHATDDVDDKRGA